MRILWAFGAALALPFSQACTGTSPSAQTDAKPLDRSCRVAIAASAGADPEIPKLQQALRDQRQPARTAEQLGYRFIARARLSNDPGFYTLAEQTAVCMDSIEPGDPAALLLRGH